MHMRALANKPAGAGRTRTKELRREQLIRATIKSVAKRGLSGTTMADVTREAGLSLGIVNLHFRSKDRLLLETLQYLSDEYRQAWEKAIAKCKPDPAEQLAALVAVDFSRTVFDRNKIAVWFAFWGEAKSRPTYMRICEAHDRHYHRLLCELCAAIVSDGGYEDVDPDVVATSLSAMTDGLWLDFLVAPETIDAQRGRAICMAYLASIYPAHFAHVQS